MKRSDLKMLIKECLVELLAEGLGQGLNEAVSYPSRPAIAGRAATPPNRARQQQKDPFLDRRVTPQARTALQEAIKTEARGNSMMADLLADTAVTTLQTQYASGDTANGGPGPGISQQEQFSGNPEDVFGEAASKWADLAFASVPHRPQG